MYIIDRDCSIRILWRSLLCVLYTYEYTHQISLIEAINIAFSVFVSFTATATLRPLLSEFGHKPRGGGAFVLLDAETRMPEVLRAQCVSACVYVRFGGCVTTCACSKPPQRERERNFGPVRFPLQPLLPVRLLTTGTGTG